MFERLEMVPPDPILGLEEAFQRDPSPAKINLGVGVYQDDDGRTPIFNSVKRAEEQILRAETSKSYLAINGTPEYAVAVQTLIFGPAHPVCADGLTATAHTPGGTGGLRIAADFLKGANPEATVWVSQPTWPNHPNVFRAAGLRVETYPYFNAAANTLAFDEMRTALGRLPAGDVVVFHGSCHNPTGIDPSPEQWTSITEIVEERQLLALVDFAYQGLAEGIPEDAGGVRTLCSRGREMLIASSFSKNFGLYNERTGALTLVAGSRAAAQASLSHIKQCIRANYSNPPAHGAKIVTTILQSTELSAQWEAEVAAMRMRIRAMRRRFVCGLAAAGVTRDFSFIERQHGMFSFTGLTKDQVRRLREEHSIYMVESGRVNVAGMTEANLPTLCEAVAAVLQAEEPQGDECATGC
jgi:aspartate/tyrosine/aromatic aminotransferase